jgi:hypothetical protein
MQLRCLIEPHWIELPAFENKKPRAALRGAGF